GIESRALSPPLPSPRLGYHLPSVGPSPHSLCPATKQGIQNGPSASITAAAERVVWLISDGKLYLVVKTKPGGKDLDSDTIRGTNNKVVKAGDCVLMRPAESEKPPFFHGAKELILSGHFDVQSAHTIECERVVHAFKKYTKLENVGADDHFCRFEYKAADGAFTPDHHTSVNCYLALGCCKREMPYNSGDLMVLCEGCEDRKATFSYALLYCFLLGSSSSPIGMPPLLPLPFPPPSLLSPSLRGRGGVDECQQISIIDIRYLLNTKN
ncbi:BAH, partial [Musa troglodytarum]